MKIALIDTLRRLFPKNKKSSNGGARKSRPPIPWLKVPVIPEKLVKKLFFVLLFANIGMYYLFVSNAATSSVRFVLFCSTDSCNSNTSVLDGLSNEVQSWYTSKVGKSFNKLPTITVTGSQPAGFYSNNTGGDTVTTYNRVRDDLSSKGYIDADTKTVVMLGFKSLSNCGVGSGSLAITDPTHGCSNIKASVLAHELGHTLLSSTNADHTSDGSLMHAPLACNGAQLSSCALNASHSSSINSSPWFNSSPVDPGTPPTGCATSGAIAVTSKKNGTGHWFVNSAGIVSNCNSAGHFGDLRGVSISPYQIVGIAATPSGNGYWLVTNNGGIFPYGDAANRGSASNLALSKPIVGITAHPSNGGYWMVASDGGIFAFGTSFWGSTGAIRLNQAILGMAPTASGNGYWLYAGDGGIFAFGDAAFHGSTGAIRLSQPIVAMTAHPSGGGYWLVARDGGVFAFGNAGFYGSAGSSPPAQPIVGFVVAPDGQGYTIMTSSGVEYKYGTATGTQTPATDQGLMPTFRTGMSWHSAWPQHRNPTGVQMNWYTAWDGGALPGYCAKIFETNEPWEETWEDNQLCSNIDLGMWYTSAWPASQGLPGNCVRLLENAEPPERTWSDNVICTDKVDINLRFSEAGSLADANTTCVNLNEGAEWEYWADNYLCWNTYWPDLISDPLPAGCVFINEPAEPWQETWGDNVLCASPDIGLSYTSAWPANQPIDPKCVNIFEPGDSSTWADNVLCSSTYVGLHWSYTGNTDSEDTDCILMNEPSDPHHWGDNYLCWYVPPAVAPPPPPPSGADLIVTDITWTPAPPQSGNQVTFSATIKNIGTGHTPEGVVHGIAFKVDGTQVSSSVGNSASLAPGASRTQVADIGQFTHTWTATSGSHTIEATVDANNLITNELNETNNKFSKTLVTNAPPADTTAPTIPTNLNATATSPTQVNLSWTASTDNVGVTKYNVYRVLGTGGTATLLAQPTNTTYNDVTATANTTYTYTVRALDAANNLSATAAKTITTPSSVIADTAAPNVPTITVTPASSTQINLSWVAPADNPTTGASGVKGYRIYRNIGTTPAAATDTPVKDLLSSATPGTTVTWGESGLTANTTYTYTVKAYDAATTPNVSAASTPKTVTTSSSVTPATLTLNPTDDATIQSMAGAAANYGTKIAINVDKTDGISNDQQFLMKFNVTGVAGRSITSAKLVLYNTNNSSVGGSFYKVTNNNWNESAVTWNNAPVADTTPFATLATVASGSTYQVDVKPLITGDGIFSLRATSTSTDGAAYASKEATTVSQRPQLVLTFAAGDTTPPNAPTGLRTTAVAYNKVDLAWTASNSTDTIKYQVSRNGRGIASITSGTSFSDSTVVAGTTYTYTVNAFDAANNISPASNQLSVAVPTSADTTPPVTPTGFTVTPVNSNRIDLRWTASTSTDVVSYYIYRNGNLYYNLASPAVTYSDTSSITASTQYSYYVRAVDAAGNFSPVTTTITVTTPPASTADTAAPNVPASLTATPVNSSQVNLSWVAPADNPTTGASGVKGYRIYRNIGTTPAAATATPVKDLLSSAAPNTTVTWGESGLTAGTTYTYTVKAYDAAATPNVSAASTPKTVTTPASVTPATLTLNPTDDANIVQNSPGSNYGTGATLYVTSGAPVYNYLMKFNVTGVNGRRVTSAKLKLYVKDGSTTGGSFYPVGSSWSEGAVTWNNAPVATASPVFSLPAVSGSTYVMVDLASLITGDGSYSLRSNSTDANSAGYASKEDVNKPQLILTVE